MKRPIGAGFKVLAVPAAVGGFATPHCRQRAALPLAYPESSHAKWGNYIVG
jgi:hypothetical protein